MLQEDIHSRQVCPLLEVALRVGNVVRQVSLSRNDSAAASWTMPFLKVRSIILADLASCSYINPLCISMGSSGLVRARSPLRMYSSKLELRLLESRALLIGKVSSPSSGELANALDFLEGLVMSSSVHVHSPLLMAYTNSRTA